MDIIKSIEHEQLKDKIPDLKVGDTVRVHQKIKEGNRERIQVFEGIIIKKQGGGLNATFTVRKIAYGVGVEKTFLIHSFGIKGIVKVNAYTDDPLEFANLKTILIEKNKKLLEFEIEEAKLHKNQVLLKIKGIDDINEAEKYRGCFIKIPREKAKKLPKDTYFIADLIGLQVYTDSGELLGKVDDIYNSGSADIYVVKDELGKQILLPGIKDVIKQIDVDNEKIIVHLIDGLI